MTLFLITLALAVGCASSKLSPTQTASSEQIPQPGVLLVYDFAVGPDDVVVDTLGHEFQSEATELTKEQKTAYATAASLSEQLVEKLTKRGIAAERSDDGRVPPLHAIVIKGQFLTINKGSRVKRMVIGFGAGSTARYRYARRRTKPPSMGCADSLPRRSTPTVRRCQGWRFRWRAARSRAPSPRRR